jgi:DNA-binding response OmpR family regulator
MRLLLIEDSQDLIKELADFFESQGDIIDTAVDGITGLHLAVVNDYDAIVLDLGLPGISGLELCKHLREKAQKWVPVLMLTARDTLEDKICGFEQGADDYLVKPFSLKELKLRLEALTRRHLLGHQQSTLAFSDLMLNTATREANRNGKPIELTVIEFKILELLMQHAPNVVSREDIEYIIWGDIPPNHDSLRVHIHHLRQVIDKPFTRPALLHTIRGVGFQLK